MATVINPQGSPSVIFNKDGTAMIEVVSARSTEALPIIAAFARKTMVLIDKPSPNNDVTGIKLSDDFQIGDVVEFYSYPEFGWSYQIYDHNDNVLTMGDKWTKMPDGSWRRR